MPKGRSISAQRNSLSLEDVANKEKKVPAEWITIDGAGLNNEYIKYALPLIQGESKPPVEDGMPRFANLKKIIAE